MARVEELVSAGAEAGRVVVCRAPCALALEEQYVQLLQLVSTGVVFCLCDQGWTNRVHALAEVRMKRFTSEALTAGVTLASSGSGAVFDLPRQQLLRPRRAGWERLPL